MRHLAVRLAGSLRPGGPPPTDERWARNSLLPGEQALWTQMSGRDRRHAVGVARATIADLGADRGGSASRPVVAAALLHDVGKLDAGLGTWARVAVTLVAMAVGRDRVASWSDRESPAGEDGARRPAPDLSALDNPAPAPDGRGHTGRGRTARRRAAAGRYVTHDRLGAELLRAAGSDPLTVAWAAEHHLPAGRWSVDRRMAGALKAADGD